MRKRNNAASTYEHCSICSPNDDEVSCINNSLLSQIRDVLSIIKDSYDQQAPKLESLDFGRLLKMIYSKKFKNLKATSSCKHLQLKKIFVGDLKCSQKQIDRACGVLSWKIAKRSFHTDVIISQSKSFLRHFIQTEQKAGENSKVSSSKKEEVQSSLDKKVKQEYQEQEMSDRNMENEENLGQINCQFINRNMEPNFEHFPLYYPITWHPTNYIFHNPEMGPQAMLPDKK